jgi:hypothetical protein
VRGAGKNRAVISADSVQFPEHGWHEVPCERRCVMDEQELLERYEARGDERDFLAAKPLYEQALGEAEDAWRLYDFGYLLTCHSRREMRRAVELYERAIELDPKGGSPMPPPRGERSSPGTRPAASRCRQPGLVGTSSECARR